MTLYTNGCNFSKVKGVLLLYDSCFLNDALPWHHHTVSAHYNKGFSFVQFWDNIIKPLELELEYYPMFIEVTVIYKLNLTTPIVKKTKTVLTFFVPPWVVVINPSSNLSQSCLEKPSEPLLLITLTKTTVGVKSGGYTGAPPCNLLTVCTLKEFEPVLSHNNFHWTSEEKDHKDKSSTTTPGDISVAR